MKDSKTRKTLKLKPEFSTNFPQSFPQKNYFFPLFLLTFSFLLVKIYGNTLKPLIIKGLTWWRGKKVKKGDTYPLNSQKQGGNDSIFGAGYRFFSTGEKIRVTQPQNHTVIFRERFDWLSQVMQYFRVGKAKILSKIKNIRYRESGFSGDPILLERRNHETLVRSEDRRPAGAAVYLV
jgi:hypothetical protein